MMRRLRLALPLLVLLGACQSSRTLGEPGVDAEPNSQAWCDAGLRLAGERRDAAWAAGRCFENGYGGFQTDNERAISFYMSAAQRGEIRAADDLKRLGIDVPYGRPEAADGEHPGNQTEYQHLLSDIPLPGRQSGPPPN